MTLLFHPCYDAGILHGGRSMVGESRHIGIVRHTMTFTPDAGWAEHVFSECNCGWYYGGPANAQLGCAEAMARAAEHTRISSPKTFEEAIFSPMGPGATVQCAYCGNRCTLYAPSLMNEEDWRKAESEHTKDCAWATTRAHTRESVTFPDGRKGWV